MRTENGQQTSGHVDLAHAIVLGVAAQQIALAIDSHTSNARKSGRQTINEQGESTVLYRALLPAPSAKPGFPPANVDTTPPPAVNSFRTRPLPSAMYTVPTLLTQSDCDKPRLAKRTRQQRWLEDAKTTIRMHDRRRNRSNRGQRGASTHTLVR